LTNLALSVPDETNNQRDTDPQTLLILVGLPGSGKSTFAHALETTQGGRKWTRASQDDSASKRRAEVEDTVRRALARGDNVVVDRVNFDAA
jgi:predicted kinase